MQTTLADKGGREIRPGDILKVFHFVGARRKRHFMYKQALRYDGNGNLMISHLNRMGDEPWEIGTNYYLERADGRSIGHYEVVQSR